MIISGQLNKVYVFILFLFGNFPRSQLSLQLQLARSHPTSSILARSHSTFFLNSRSDHFLLHYLLAWVHSNLSPLLLLTLSHSSSSFHLRPFTVTGACKLLQEKFDSVAGFRRNFVSSVCSSDLSQRHTLIILFFIAHATLIILYKNAC